MAANLGRRPSRSDASGRERYWFTVEGLYPERSLVLRASLDLRTGRSYDPRGKRPSAFSDSTWAFYLEPLVADETRLLVRSRVDAWPHWRAALVSIALVLPSHAVMQQRQFRNLKRLAEAQAEAPASALSRAA